MTDPAPAQIPPALPTVPSAQKIPGLAIAALVLGIVSMMGAAILIVPTVLAIVFGHISFSRIRRNPALTGSGIAMAGFILGYVSIVFGTMISGLFAAMAIPAFQKVREESLRKAMANDARQIAAAVQQVMLEKGEQRLEFHVDDQTGTVSGPLFEYVKHITRGTHEVDGVLENANDSFSLQNPRVYGGREITFDSEGRMQSPRH